MVNPYQKRQKIATTTSIQTAQERYRYFIQTIVQSQKIWGLFDDGWAIAATSQGQNALALWADKSYAQLCQGEFWKSYQAQSLSLNTFIFEMLPHACEEKVLLSLMMTPEGQSIYLEPRRVLLDLKHYLYELYTTTPQFFLQHPDVPLPRKIRLHAI